MKHLDKLWKNEKIQKICWKLLNNTTTLLVASVTFYATENVAWAVTIAPFVKALSEITTRVINEHLKNG